MAQNVMHLARALLCLLRSGSHGLEAVLEAKIIKVEVFHQHSHSRQVWGDCLRFWCEIYENLCEQERTLFGERGDGRERERW